MSTEPPKEWTEEDQRRQDLLLYPELSDPPRIPYPGDHILMIAYNFALLGLNDQQLADVLCEGDVDNLHHWCRLWHGFKNCIDRGRLLADAEVAAALFNRAKGYQLSDVRKRYHINKDNEPVLVGYEERTQHVPASVDAIELWLKTRQPTAWPLKPIQPEQNPNEPTAGDDDLDHIIRRLTSLRDRKQQPEPSSSDPDGPVD